MSRYTGPINKKSRRYKFSILENNKEFIKGKKRITSPGQHGAKRQKLSSYGEHLYEKQKVRYMYGLTEKQMRRTFEKAIKMDGVVGENFLFLLESRLDNLVYRTGIASTRRQSRQFVNHGNILVNGRKVDIPSYVGKIGDIISVKESFKKNSFIQHNIKEESGNLFINFDDKDNLNFTFERLPKREELSREINESLIVEFYNK